MGTSPPGKEYTRNEVLSCLADACALISDEVYDADDLMGQALALAGFSDDEQGTVYSREAVISRLNYAADAVLDGPQFDGETGTTIAQRSLIDLLVNVAGAVLDNPAMTLREAIEIGWADLDAEECDSRGIAATVLGWLDDLP